VDFLQVRGEYVSLALVAVLLWLAVRPIAAIVGVPRKQLGELVLDAGVAFVAAARLAYLLIEDRGAFTDPLVAIQIQTGLEPLAGAIAALAVVAWRSRALPRPEQWAWLLAAATAFAVATMAYDGACVVREACYGAPAPAPLGFRMSGLADTRIATPLVEAALLLAALGGLVSFWPRLTMRTRALGLLSALALLRAALTPLSVREWDAVDVETYVLVAAAALTFAAAAWRPTAPRVAQA